MLIIFIMIGLSKVQMNTKRRIAVQEYLLNLYKKKNIWKVYKSMTQGPATIYKAYTVM